MAERELGLVKSSVGNLKEQVARITLRKVRSQGHNYVDLREDGKRYIFFCTLCLSPCYNDTVLFDHLSGNLHKERLLAAKATLIGHNPWPFNDGVFFFHNSNSNSNSLDHPHQLAIVVHNPHPIPNTPADFLIPRVILKDQISDLHVSFMGSAKISARFILRDALHPAVQRIWCEWLGNMPNITSSVPSHDFAILTFTYYYDLGKQGLFDEIKTLLFTTDHHAHSSTKRTIKSFSDSEDITYQCDSSGDDSQALTSALLLHRYDDQLLHSRIISNKTLRRELRRQQRVASEKMCDICQHKMLPGKDVATLLNLKTGRLACSSRNVHGAFHVFHTSCLIHWLLLCENEMLMKPMVKSKARRRSKRKTKSKFSQLGKECRPDPYGIRHKQKRKGSDEGTSCDRISSVFCPDCQGTGLQIEGDELEKPTVHLSEMFKYKIKAIDAHRAWMKCPEKLENCSTGFAFPVLIDVEGKVSDVKLLHFYRADEGSWCS